MISLKRPLQHSAGAADVIHCCCTFIEQAECPHTGAGCGRFLEDMSRRYGYQAPDLSWGYTSETNIRGGLRSFERYTVPCRALKDVPAIWRQQMKEKKWSLHRCRLCDFVTHAVSTQPRESASTPAAVAVMANIDCSVQGCDVGCGGSRPSVLESEIR